MAYSPEVERWRPIVAQYFRPEDVDKALYVIQGESGGNPNAVGDGGASHGLFQLNDNGLGSGTPASARLDPETNIRIAAQAVYGGSGWRPWGEGTEHYDHPYNPQTGTGYFGALGHNPYPGGGATQASAPGGGAVPYQDWLDRYTPIYQQYKVLDAKLQPWLGSNQEPVLDMYPDPALGLVVLVPGGIDPTTLEPTVVPEIVMSWDEWQQYVSLEGQLNALEEEFGATYGGEDLGDAIARADFFTQNDPRNVDAANAADEFAREMDIRSQAAGLAATAAQQQERRLETALASQGDFAAGRLGDGPRTGAFAATPARLMSTDELFEQALSKVREDLPDVPGFVGADTSGIPRGGGAPSLPQIRGGIDAQGTPRQIERPPDRGFVDHEGPAGAFGVPRGNRSATGLPWEVGVPAARPSAAAVADPGGTTQNNFTERLRSTFGGVRDLAGDAGGFFGRSRGLLSPISGAIYR